MAVWLAGLWGQGGWCEQLQRFYRLHFAKRHLVKIMNALNELENGCGGFGVLGWG
jgi:hypothetical protein